MPFVVVFCQYMVPPAPPVAFKVVLPQKVPLPLTVTAEGAVLNVCLPPSKALPARVPAETVRFPVVRAGTTILSFAIGAADVFIVIQKYRVVVVTDLVKATKVCNPGTREVDKVVPAWVAPARLLVVLEYN